MNKTRLLYLFIKKKMVVVEYIINPTFDIAPSSIRSSSSPVVLSHPASLYQ